MLFRGENGGVPLHDLDRKNDRYSAGIKGVSGELFG